MKSILILITLYQLLQFVSLQYLPIRRYFFGLPLPENYNCGFYPLVHSGKCKKIKDCSSVTTKERPIEICQINFFDPSSTLVCCSPDEFSESRSHVPLETEPVRKGPLHYETCIEKYKSYRTIEDESAFVFTVNGVEVEQGKFSHAAALGWIRWDDLSVNWHCGGSLITESFVVTATHCTNVRGLAPQIVRVGDLNLESINDDQYVQQKSIINIIPHPGYDQTRKSNDIALIQLAGPIV